MMTAALEGIISSSNTSNKVPFHCPTGNCDFAPYSSLAYCSSCTDITSHVEEQFGPGYTSPGSFYWNYTLPGQDCQLQFKDTDGHPRLTRTGATGAAPTHLIVCPGDWNGEHICRSATNFTILSMSWANCSKDLIGCGDYPEQLPSLAGTSSLVAMNCSLGLCVRDYTGEVRNGILHEITTSNLMPDKPSKSSILKLPCIVDSNKYDISNISQVSHVPGRIFTTVRANGRNVTAPIECVFKTMHLVPGAINEFLSSVLFSNGLDGPLGYNPKCRLGSRQGTSSCNPWHLLPLFRDGTLTAATISSDMSGIADAISNRIRAVGSNAYRNGPGHALGTVIQTTVCVHVEWPWLLLPGALVLLTVFLFVAMIVVTRHSQVADGQPIWKSSALVAFFHGIDARFRTQGRGNGYPGRFVASASEPENPPASASVRRRESHRDLMTLKSMHARAKKIVVKLDTTATGQRGFVMVNKEEDHNSSVPNNNDGQRRSADFHRDGETLPLAQLSAHSSLRGQDPAYLQVDLGIGLAASIRGSLDSSTQFDLEGSPERGSRTSIVPQSRSGCSEPREP